MWSSAITCVTATDILTAAVATTAVGQAAVAKLLRLIPAAVDTSAFATAWPMHIPSQPAVKLARVAVQGKLPKVGNLFKVFMVEGARCPFIFQLLMWMMVHNTRHTVLLNVFERYQHWKIFCTSVDDFSREHVLMWWWYECCDKIIWWEWSGHTLHLRYVNLCWRIGPGANLCQLQGPLNISFQVAVFKHHPALLCMGVQPQLTSKSVLPATILNLHDSSLWLEDSSFQMKATS